MTKNPVMIAAMAAAALALGACGSSGGNDSGKPSKSDEDKAYAGALKFAKCMRDNGIDMPDPQKQANGGIVQKMGGGPGSDKPLNQTKVEAAQKKCEHFMQTGGGNIKNPGDDSKQRDAMLAYSKCMRQNGVPKFPDPKFTAHGAELSIRSKDGSVNLNPDAPAFKAAEKVCQSKLADVMGGGPSTAKKGE